MSPWKKFRYKLEWVGLRSLASLIPKLPRGLAHRVGVGLGKLAFIVDKRGRTTALENLTLVFGEEKSEKEIEQIAKDSYQSFARTVMDQLSSPKLTEENFSDHMEVVSDYGDEMDETKKTGAIWVTPHYSNFEWIALIQGFRGFRFTVIAQDFKNEALTEIYRRNREVSGHDVIPQKNALIKLVRALKNNGHAAFLSDLTIRPGKAATVIECFGKKTCVTAIHPELQMRTGLPVIPGICIPLPNGRYEMRGFKPLVFGPNDTQQTIAQACWDVFEKVIREDPAPWLWMYKHWRYLPSADAEGYPSYARHAEKFEDMIREIEASEQKAG